MVHHSIFVYAKSEQVVQIGKKNFFDWDSARISYLFFVFSNFKIDPCSSSPCVRGTCIPTTNAYTCQCPTGITGSKCEIDIDECQSQPCLNGGTCLQPSVGLYQCSCTAQYTGLRCETSISLCRSDLCLYNGTCVDTSINNSPAYLCQCQPGYTGKILRSI